MLADLPDAQSAAAAAEQLIADATADGHWLRLADITDRALGTSLHRGESQLGDTQQASKLSLSRYGVLSENAVSRQQLQELQASIQEKLPAIPWQESRASQNLPRGVRRR